jgi:hypothetical protein
VHRLHTGYLRCLPSARRLLVPATRTAHGGADAASTTTKYLSGCRAIYKMGRRRGGASSAVLAVMEVLLAVYGCGAAGEDIGAAGAVAAAAAAAAGAAGAGRHVGGQSLTGTRHMNAAPGDGTEDEDEGDAAAAVPASASAWERIFQQRYYGRLARSARRDRWYAELVDLWARAWQILPVPTTPRHAF